MAPSSLTNQLKLMQIDQAIRAPHEVLSLLEPHKIHQGSVTMVRKLALPSRTRAEECDYELATLGVEGATFSQADVHQRR